MWFVRRSVYRAMVAVAAMTMFCQSAWADRNAPDCSVRQNALGVSRVVEIDAIDGLRFGRMQYKDLSFLKKGEVVLTFDDGPLRRHTATVLNALDAECTKATFFMTGRMAVHDPAMVRLVDRRGHTVATHTWSHKNLKRLSRARAEREMELGISAVSAALGKPPSPFFRFPYLSYSKSTMAYLASRDAGMFSIDVDSKDYQTRNGNVMVGRTMARLKKAGKGILLFHDIQRSTASGIRALLRKLRKAGFKVVHIVSKKPAVTIPKYDAMALRELAKRKRSWSSRPSPEALMTWPVSRNLPAREALRNFEPVAPVEPVATEPRAGDVLERRITRPSTDGAAKRGDDGLDGQDTKRANAKRTRRLKPRPVAQKRVPSLRRSIDPLQNQISPR